MRREGERQWEGTGRSVGIGDQERDMEGKRERTGLEKDKGREL